MQWEARLGRSLSGSFCALPKKSVVIHGADRTTTADEDNKEN